MLVPIRNSVFSFPRATADVTLSGRDRGVSSYLLILLFFFSVFFSKFFTEDL
ncbi:hypothetical protein BDV12DRAFT_166818 [Aspergillus spectabilis]